MLNDRASDREAFLSTVDREIAASADSLAVLRLDLDRFHRIRDTFGAGTARLVHNRLISRLEGIVGQPQRLLTYGPASFIALVDVTGCDPVTLEAAGMQVIETVSEPIDVDGQRIAVGCSAGIASAADFTGSDALRIVAAAELAVQRANALGSRRAVVYRPAESSDPTRLPTLFADMLAGIESAQFIPYFQPVVALPELAVVGAEAVARWQHADHGLLLPADFMAEAESSGLIRHIDESIRRAAMHEVSHWPSTGLVLSINLSGADLDAPDLVDDIADCLASTSLAPGRIIFEVTETTLAQDWTRALERLRALRELGLRLAVDDFGTGHMFLDRLTSGVFDILKIDRSLISDDHDHDRADALLGGITAIAHDLGMQVVAEGVETTSQLERVLRAGCDRAQGFLFGRPVSPTDFTASLLPA